MESARGRAGIRSLPAAKPRSKPSFRPEQDARVRREKQRPSARTLNNQLWNHEGRKGLKGLQPEEGLRTLEMSSAVGPHGSGVHGSRPAPTCWVRRKCRAGRPRKHGSSRPVDRPVASPLPRATTPTQQRCRVCPPSFRGRNAASGRQGGSGKAQTSGLRRLKI